MAHIIISVLGDKYNPDDKFSARKVLDSVEIIGKKMSDAWMRKTYGRFWKQDYHAMYYVKSHKYGVSWVIDMADAYGGHRIDMACDNTYFKDRIDYRISIK